jgi:Ca2+-binding EF-hand superfamily protein
LFDVLSSQEKKSPDFLEKYFEKMDTDHNERINFSEFLSIVAEVTTEFHDQSHEPKP